jgi:hypothetical protein
MAQSIELCKQYRTVILYRHPPFHVQFSRIWNYSAASAVSIVSYSCARPSLSNKTYREVLPMERHSYSPGTPQFLAALTISLILSLLCASPPARAKTRQFTALCLPRNSLMTANLPILPASRFSTPLRNSAGVSFVELEETCPSSLSADRPCAQWLLWEADMKTVESRMGLFAIRDMSYYVTLPSGSFLLVVELNTLAMVKGTSREGLLTCLSFDPAARKKLGLHMPELIEAAKRNGMLEGPQTQMLQKRQAELVDSHEEFSLAWQRFMRSPGAPGARNAFFDHLITLQRDIAILDQIDPRAFFTRAQRITLRSMGEVIRGTCIHDYSHNVITLKDYPLSQLVSDWNSGRIWSHGTVNRLSVRKGREHDEADISVKLRLPTHDPINEKLLREALLGVDGIM